METRKTLPRTLELAAVIAVVYPIDRLWAAFGAPHTETWPFFAKPLPFLLVLLSFLVLLYVPTIKKVYDRARNA